VLHAPGMEPQPVEVQVRVPHSELPLTAGEVWNVQFERSQPSHVKFPWPVVDELDRQSRNEIDRELKIDDVRALEAARRRAKG
jgi:hypothetical protein